MVLGGVISNLLSLGAKLLPAVNSSAQQASSSSSSPPIESQKIEDELRRLMSMVNRIKDTLYDAEQREIRDLSVRNWLKELKEVALDAEDVLDEYHYEVLRAEVEARDSSRPFVLVVQKTEHLITEEFVNLGKKMPENNHDHPGWFGNARDQDELIIMRAASTCWNLWKERNRQIFRVLRCQKGCC